MEAAFDVGIVGAGPAGCACAYMLRHSGLSVALIEKGDFPKDKICGDGLTLDIIQQLERMDPELARRFEALPQKVASMGVKVFGPSIEELRVSFFKHGQQTNYYVCERKVFDQFLFDQCLPNTKLSVFLNTRITDVQYSEHGITLQAQENRFHCKLVVGADGAHSVVASKLQQKTIDRKHHLAGLRRYYEQVSFGPNDHDIEFHFFKDTLPGYLWVFPLPDGKANVGICALSSTISARNMDLKKEFNRLLETHPALKDRFKSAKPLESIHGHGLPLASRKMNRSGNRYLLLGDAASLVDPCSGEGIGNAIRSGRFAAEAIQEAFLKQAFDASFLKCYDKRLKQALGSEVKVSRIAQRLMAHPAVISYLIRKFNKSDSLKRWVSEFLHSNSKSANRTLPKLLVKLIFA